MSAQGKFARLPKDMRNTVSRLIEDGRSAREIFSMLEAEGFGAEWLAKNGFTENESAWKDANLTAYRQGGHQIWLRSQERTVDAELRREAIEKIIEENKSVDLSQAATHIAMGQIYELLDQINLEEIRTAMAGDHEAYAELLKNVARLAKPAVEIDRHRAALAEMQRKISAELSQVKAGDSLTPETLQRIQEALNLK